MLSLITSLLPSIFGTIDTAIESKTERERIKQQIQLALLQNQNEIQKAASEVVLAEAKGNWYVSAWRPTLAYVIIAIIGFNYLIQPLLSMFGIQAAIQLDMPTEMWVLLNVCLGGYILSRGGEKISETMKKK